MSRDDTEHFEGVPLTETEIRYVRKMMRDDQRISWLWATLRVWVGWATAAGAFLYTVYEPLIRAIKAAFNVK
jgi:hypothetical protein